MNKVLVKAIFISLAIASISFAGKAKNPCKGVDVEKTALIQN